MKLGLCALLSSVMLSASVAYAQSEGDGADVTPDDAPVSVEVQSGAVDALAYLQMTQSMPFGLWEARLNNTLRMYRLGVASRDAADEQFQELRSAALVTAAQLQSLTPPPQFADVHALNIGAATEYAAAFELAPSTLDGDPNARAAANAHITRAEDLASQALQQLR